MSTLFLLQQGHLHAPCLWQILFCVWAFSLSRSLFPDLPSDPLLSIESDKNVGFVIREIWAPMLVQIFSSCVTLAKLLNIAES
jgi:hypothetical protein